MNTRADERLARLQARMVETSTDLVAIGPTANLRYLLGFVPHADERICLLLVDRHSVRMVVPGLNEGEVAEQTTVELFG
jgi:Xaa-Pro dipeptidase